MIVLVAVLITLYWLIQTIEQGQAFWSAMFALPIGIVIGKAVVMTYRRGEIVTLERKLAAQREWDEEGE